MKKKRASSPAGGEEKSQRQPRKHEHVSHEPEKKKGKKGTAVTTSRKTDHLLAPEGTEASERRLCQISVTEGKEEKWGLASNPETARSFIRKPEDNPNPTR